MHAAQAQRVLVVDDEPALLDALTTALERSGRTVVACRSFAQARQEVLDDGFDVLVTDVRLGAFNGIQLAVMARDKHPDMRIVVFSGYDDPVLREEALRLNATYLVKPVSSESLITLITGP